MVRVGGKWEKTMKNQRKPPSPDSLTETGLSTFPTQLKAEWTEVDGAGREEKRGRRRREKERGSGGNKDLSVSFSGI